MFRAEPETRSVTKFNKAVQPVQPGRKINAKPAAVRGRLLTATNAALVVSLKFRADSRHGVGKSRRLTCLSCNLGAGPRFKLSLRLTAAMVVAVLRWQRSDV